MTRKTRIVALEKRAGIVEPMRCTGIWSGTGKAQTILGIRAR